MVRFPVTGSVKFLTVATQTSETNATSAKNPSPKLPAIPQVRSLLLEVIILLLTIPRITAPEGKKDEDLVVMKSWTWRTRRRGISIATRWSSIKPLKELSFGGSHFIFN